MLVKVFHQLLEGVKLHGVKGEVPVPFHVINIIPLSILQRRDAELHGVEMLLRSCLASPGRQIFILPVVSDNSSWLSQSARFHCLSHSPSGTDGTPAPRMVAWQGNLEQHNWNGDNDELGNPDGGGNE